MSRPYDWSPVDRSEDPVPGDGSVIDSVVATWVSLADDADWARGRISALLGDGAVVAWVGKAGDAFRDHSSKLPDQLSKASASYRGASSALAVWSTDLTGCQSSADRGLALARDAQADLRVAQSQLHTAQANAASASAASRSVSETATKYATAAPPAGTTVPDPSVVAAAARRATAAGGAVTSAQGSVEAAQSRIDAAKRMVNDAVSLRDERGRVTAGKLRDAADAGIPPDSFWKKVGDALGKAWHVLIEIAKVVVLIGGIIALIVGGPLAWIVFAAAVLILVDTAVKYAQGRATLLDVGLALLSCIPCTKGLTTLAELSAAFKAGGMLGAGAHVLAAGKTAIVSMAQGVKALAGNLKTITVALGERSGILKSGITIVKGDDGIFTVVCDVKRWPESGQHITEAQGGTIWRGDRSRLGDPKPDIVTIDRPGAAARGRAAVSPVPPKPRAMNIDRDEYPPKVFLEGGKGASVKYIDAPDNRGFGGHLGNRLSGLPDGTPVRIVVK